jgi:hypothetical protein
MKPTELDVSDKSVAEGPFAGAMQSSWIAIALAALAFAVCCLRSFVLPHTPFLFWGDQLGFAAKGARVLQGELPYRDFFDFVTPGTTFVYAALFRIFGVSMSIPNLLMAFLAAAATLWTTWCAQQLMRGIFVIVPPLLTIGLVLSSSMDATHHWFSTLAAMAAIAALFQGISSLRIATAGAFCGVAATFTQTKGAAVLLALIIYLIWTSQQERASCKLVLKNCLLLTTAALALFLAINGPLILAAGATRWADDLIIYPLRYFGSVPATNWRGAWPEFLEHRGILKWLTFPFVYISVPLTYLWFFAAMSRRPKQNDIEPWNKLFLLAVAGVALLLAIAPALSIKRISCVSPLAMILLIWLLSRGGKVIAKTLAAISVAVAAAQIIAIQTHPKLILDLPVGRVAIPDPQNYELYRWMSEHTHPGQWYFGLPPMTLPLGLRNATPVESIGPGEFTRPEQVTAVIQDLDAKHVPLIVLRPISNRRLQPDNVDHSQPFRDYLYQHYRRTKIFSTGDEVWELINP